MPSTLQEVFEKDWNESSSTSRRLWCADRMIILSKSESTKKFYQLPLELQDRIWKAWKGIIDVDRKLGES